MERQYIGARYVPKFFENPNTGDSTWLTGVAYESLTIVTFAGNSYTSKKPVPAGIGSPNLNPEYWVSTGNFNEQVHELGEQVQELGEQVQEISDDVDGILPITPNKLATKKYILITDSYGSYTDAQNKNFMTLACEYAGIDPANVYATYRGSSGFSKQGTLNFLDVLQSIEAGITDPNEITDVFVFGGANDQVSSDADAINTGISNFCSYVKTRYPNANIYIGFVTKSWDGNFYPNYPTALKCYTECGRYGANYLPGSENIMSLNTLFRSDHVHPTTDAVEHIAKYVSNLLTNHSCEVAFQTITTRVLTIENTGISANIIEDHIALTYKNGSSVIDSRNGGAGLLFTCVTSIPSFDSTISGIKLMKCFNPPLYNNSNTLLCTVVCFYGESSLPKAIPGFLSFKNTPNEDGSYNATLIVYSDTAIQNVNKILIGVHGTMNS